MEKKKEHDLTMTTSLTSFAGQTVTWIPTATFKDRYDLIAPDNTTLATLDMSGWTSRAKAAVPEGTLFIQKAGAKVVLSLGEQGPLLATYHSKWTGTSGQLSFLDAREFRWNKANFWGSQKCWTDPAGNTAYAQFSTGGFSRKVTVEIHPQAAAIPELSFLLVLGLYNILLERRNAALVGTIAATS
jgi:hypothetical protein